MKTDRHAKIRTFRAEQVSKVWKKYGTGQPLKKGFAEWFANMFIEFESHQITDILIVGSIIAFKRFTDVQPWEEDL